MSHWFGIASLLRWLPFLLPSDDGAASGLPDPEPSPPKPSDEDTAEILDGRFKLKGLLGAGGFGEVYKAVQLSTGQQVAVKLIRPEVLRDAPEPENLRERFRRETAIVASLNHPHVVSLVDAGEAEDGRLYAAYEFVKGETLTNYLVRRGTLSEHRTLMIMSQVLDALAAAHDRQVVHRDLKPDNIMLRHGSIAGMTNVVVLDFGIATLQEEARKQGEWQELTAANAMPGTPSYMSPEQIMRPSDVGPWSDVYAWGLIYCECLRGAKVYTGETPGAVMLSQASSAEVPLPEQLEGSALGEVIAKSVAKQHDERFKDASEALAALTPHIPYATQVLEAVKPSEDYLPTAPLQNTSDNTLRLQTQDQIPTQQHPIVSSKPHQQIKDTLSLVFGKASLTLTASGNKAPLMLAALIPLLVFVSVLVLMPASEKPELPQVPPGEPTTAPSPTTDPSTIPTTPTPTPTSAPTPTPTPAPTPTPTPAPTPTPSVSHEPVKNCEQGRVLVDGDQCCWPLQIWDEASEQCIGTPRCPKRTTLSDESCEPLNDEEWKHYQYCAPNKPQGRGSACGVLGAKLKHRKAYAAAAHILTKACERGHNISCTGAAGALRHSSNHTEANRLLELGCSRNHAASCHTLASHIERGHYNLTRDWPRAEALYKKACSTTKPYSSACRALARKYFAFAERDPDQRERWINEAKTYLFRCKDRLSWCGLALLKLKEGKLP